MTDAISTDKVVNYECTLGVIHTRSIYHWLVVLHCRYLSGQINLLATEYRKLTLLLLPAACVPTFNSVAVWNSLLNPPSTYMEIH